MAAYLTTIARVLVVAVVLGFLSQSSLADRRATGPTATARTARAEPADEAENDGPPLDGLLIIAGVVALLIFVAWLGSRIGDHRSHVID